MDQPTRTTPIVCDLTSAPDTAQDRAAEYRRLFAQAMVGRERTPEGIRFRFRAAGGVEAWVRDLAAREKACCPFFAFSVRVEDDQVHWDASVVDDDIARDVLEEFYAFPDAHAETEADALQGLESRLEARGLKIITDDGGTIRHVHRVGR